MLEYSNKTGYFRYHNLLKEADESGNIPATNVVTFPLPTDSPLLTKIKDTRRDVSLLYALYNLWLQRAVNTKI